MKLKDKLFNAIFDKAWEFKTEDIVPECEKIADEFAIEFAEFIGKKTINYQDGKFRMKTLTPVLKTPEEILEIYKKEKGL
jgi:hypothetical protein